MTLQKRVTILLRGATTLDFIADELGRAAAVCATENNWSGARMLRHMAREQRVKALLSRGRAAAIFAQELPRLGG